MPVCAFLIMSWHFATFDTIVFPSTRNRNKTKGYPLLLPLHFPLCTFRTGLLFLSYLTLLQDEPKQSGRVVRTVWIATIVHISFLRKNFAKSNFVGYTVPADFCRSLPPVELTVLRPLRRPWVRPTCAAFHESYFPSTENHPTETPGTSYRRRTVRHFLVVARFCPIPHPIYASGSVSIGKPTLRTTEPDSAGSIGRRINFDTVNPLIADTTSDSDIGNACPSRRNTAVDTLGSKSESGSDAEFRAGCAHSIGHSAKPVDSVAAARRPGDVAGSLASRNRTRTR